MSYQNPIYFFSQKLPHHSTIFIYFLISLSATVSTFSLAWKLVIPKFPKAKHIKFTCYGFKWKGTKSKDKIQCALEKLNKKQRKLANNAGNNYFREFCRRIDDTHRGQLCFLRVAILRGKKAIRKKKSREVNKVSFVIA